MKKLLKLINSAAFNLRSEIESIEHGVMLLGRRKLCSWASMLAMSTLNDRPSEILRTAMTRAKMCELLAEKLGEKPLKKDEMILEMGEETYLRGREDIKNTTSFILSLDDFLRKCLIGLTLTIPIAVILRRREL